MDILTYGLLKGDIGKLSEDISNLSGGSGGLSPTAITLLISILRNAVFATDQSGNITSLETILSSGSSSGDETQEITATVEGNTLILNNAPSINTATVEGSVMTLV